MITAPLADQFPDYPASWYLFCRTCDLRGGPMSRDVLGRRLVAFRKTGGDVAVLEARCAHLGADLGAGSVIEDQIQCAFHNWRYNGEGRCVHIPASPDVPEFARVKAYPAVERHGFVFFFNDQAAVFPLPFFPGVDPDEFCAAEPFQAVLECPWWMVGANVFDVQHFRSAHDRQLMSEPVVESPAPQARRITATFAVLGDSLRDRLVRRLAGERVEMSFTDWCGNIIFATPTFRRTTSYGMLITEPLGRQRVLVHGIVFVRRSRGPIGRLVVDPLHRRVRRYFIKAFLQSDARLGTKGLRYNPESLIAGDGELIRYFDWLASVRGPVAPTT
jgi:phenylpropionate dioxygenase-like ring-hydroxylating dioxygenase large terminal subunit